MQTRSGYCKHAAGLLTLPIPGLQEVKGQAESSSEPPPSPSPFAPARPAALEHGPMPMETTLETQALCLDHGAITNAMVRAETETETDSDIETGLEPGELPAGHPGRWL
ncbi:hypothetical protein ABBQ32_009513 [Trebouxia sp. C0010 RCD-2024]